MIEPGTWQVSYSAEGYNTQTHTITVDSYASSVEKDVVLESGTSTPYGLSNFKDVALWPNPCRGELNISIDLISPSTISIDLYSLTGQKVAGITHAFHLAGEHIYQWNPVSEACDGIYLVKIRTDQGIATRKVLFKRNY
jgi:hypothetical protein